MNKFKQILTAALIAVTTFAIAGEAPGTITWKAENPGKYEAEGTFDHWHFTNVDLAGGKWEKATLEAEIDLKSINEKSDKLVSHLNAPDFFFTTSFPKATVKIHKIKATDNGYTGEAVITFKDITSKSAVNFTVNGDQIEGSTTVDRLKHKLGVEIPTITKQVEVDFSAKLPK